MRFNPLGSLILSLALAACVGNSTTPSPPPTTLAPPSTQAPLPAGSPTPFPSRTPDPRPTAQAPQPTIDPPAPPPVTRIVFTGDINPGRCVAESLIAAGDFTLPYQALGPFLRAADVLVGSLDGAVTDRAEYADCPSTMSLNGPRQIVDGFVYAGFDVMTVATNHAKNCGIVGCWDEALLDSIDTLAGAGIQPVGGGVDLDAARQPVFAELNGTTFAFVGATTVGAEMWATDTEPGTNPLKIDTIVQDIQFAKRRAEVVIVLAQWGSEYTHVPNWDQFELAGAMIEAGATLVIGNQAHWVQAVETFPTGVVAYGLGNFVFDQNWSEKTRQGVLFEATFSGSTLEGWRLLPIVIEKDYRPRWADEQEGAEILKNIESASGQAPLTTRDQPTPPNP